MSLRKELPVSRVVTSQSCHPPLLELFSVHPDFAVSPVTDGSGLPVPNASTIPLHGPLFAPARAQMYSLLCLKTCYTQPMLNQLPLNISICHVLHQMSTPPHGSCKHVLHRYTAVIQTTTLISPQTGKL